MSRAKPSRPAAAAAKQGGPSVGGGADLRVRRVVLSASQRASAPSVESADTEADAPGSTLLASFLYPLQRGEFMRDIWKQKALHIAWQGESEADSAASRHGFSAQSQPQADRMAYVKREHLFNLDVTQLLEETASDNIHVWMKPPSAAASATSADAAPAADKTASATDKAAPATKSPFTALHSFQLDGSDPGQLSAARLLHASGCSLYFRSPPPMIDEYVQGISRGVGMNFAASYDDAQPKGEIEVFLSKKGHVTDWHFDFQENFTLQLAGTKTWHLKRSGIRHPLRGATPHYQAKEVEEQQMKVHSMTRPDFSWADRPHTRVPPSAAPSCESEEYDTVTLRPGDCFYHPAGIWHRVECHDDSISVNISLTSTDWSSHVCEGIRQKLWSSDFWRSGMTFDSISSARSALSSQLSDLRSRVASLRAEDFLPAALFLPRKDNFVIQNTNVDDDNCWRLCAQAALEEARRGEGQEEEQKTEEGGSRKKQKKSATASPTGSAAPSDSSSSPSAAPLLISSLTPQSRFRPNPLAVLLRYDHAKLQREQEQAEQQQQQSAHAHANGEEEMEDDEEAEADSDADSDDEDNEEPDGEDKLGYTLHFLFGNEDVSSAARVRISVSRSLEAEMELLRGVITRDKPEMITWEQMNQQLACGTAGASERQPPAKGDKKRRRDNPSESPSVNGALSPSDRLRKLLFFLCQQGAMHLLP